MENVKLTLNGQCLGDEQESLYCPLDRARELAKEHAIRVKYEGSAFIYRLYNEYYGWQYEHYYIHTDLNGSERLLCSVYDFNHVWLCEVNEPLPKLASV